MIALANDINPKKSKIPTGHPYEYIAMHCARVVNVDGMGIRIHILLSGAYNAYGLIGPEMNGIVVLNDTKKAVVLDMVCQEPTGWYPGYSGPSERQVELFEALAEMPDAVLVAWIRSHSRYRIGSL